MSPGGDASDFDLVFIRRRRRLKPILSFACYRPRRWRQSWTNKLIGHLKRTIDERSLRRGWLSPALTVANDDYIDPQRRVDGPTGRLTDVNDEDMDKDRDRHVFADTDTAVHRHRQENQLLYRWPLVEGCIWQRFIQTPKHRRK